MYTAIARAISNGLLKRKIIEEWQLAEQFYGIKYALALTMNGVAIVAIGFALSMQVESIIFLFAFTMLRPYAGGFHFSNHLVCFLASVGMTVAVLFGSKFLLVAGPKATTATICIGSLLILALAPVAAPRKPLDAKERQVYRGRCIAILLAELIVSVCLTISGREELAAVIQINLLAIGVCLVAGIIQSACQSKK